MLCLTWLIKDWSYVLCSGCLGKDRMWDLADCANGKELGWKLWPLKCMRFLCLESRALGFHLWSVFLDTENQSAIDIHCTSPSVILVCMALRSLIAIWTLCCISLLLLLTCSVHWELLTSFFGVITQLDTLIKLQNLFNWSSVFLLITLR